MKVNPGLARKIVFALASSQVKQGALVIKDPYGQDSFGIGAPHIEVRVVDPRAYSLVLASGAAGLGEAYVKGWWHTDDLTEALRLLHANVRPFANRLDELANLNSRLANLFWRSRSESVSPFSTDDLITDKSNIKAHYDLSNEFFELILDDTMAYSCGVFDEEYTTNSIRADVRTGVEVAPSTNPAGEAVSNRDLANASRLKLKLLSDSIALTRQDHVVEIGSGWGSFAIFAAENYGCRVTTTTISDEQFEYTSKRVQDLGLRHLVEVRKDDYRNLDGQYDKLVSIEMIEAVPWNQVNLFFSKCASLLKPGGKMAMQAITINDRSYHRAKLRRDYIKEFVFPGGCLPSKQSLQIHSSSNSLYRTYQRDIGHHYPRTLREWRQNFARNRDQMPRLGLGGERFGRLWEMYFAYCEAGFLEKHVSTVQVAYVKG